jgi:hypothetical protein
MHLHVEVLTVSATPIEFICMRRTDKSGGKRKRKKERKKTSSRSFAMLLAAHLVAESLERSKSARAAPTSATKLEKPRAKLTPQA